MRYAISGQERRTKKKELSQYEEKLLKSKVQELKSIFDKEKLENLKGLKFDIEEFTKLLENGAEKLESEIEERA